MASSSLDETIRVARELETAVSSDQATEMGMLIRDLEEAKGSLFVRTAEAKPMLDRCQLAVEGLQAAIQGEGWNETARARFEEFQRAVAKLRNTILVRTQRAT